jgi:hypothetical protein
MIDIENQKVVLLILPGMKEMTVFYQKASYE